MGEKLKPCPFCGNVASLCEDNYKKIMCICDSCGALLGVNLEDGIRLKDGWIAAFNSRDEAIEAWNKRAD